jgi:polyisoprenoid-binding protein YceI
MSRKATFGCIASIVAVLFAAGLAQASTFTVDPDYSSVEFSAFGPAQGQFGDFSGTIVYTPSKAESSSVSFAVRTGTMGVLADGREIEMAGHHFFDVGKFPEITFQSRSVEVKGKTLMVTGDLSMLGITREIVLPVQILGQGLHPETRKPIAAFSANVDLKLSSFGVPAWTAAAGILGDKVAVRLNVVGVQDNQEIVKNPGSVPQS